LGTKRIAYIGIDCFDYILYLSRILHKLGKKVLVIDRSNTGALKTAVPVPNKIRPESGVITNRKVDFTMMDLDKNTFDEHDVSLEFYGFQNPNSELDEFSRITFVTDLFNHNIERLNSLGLDIKDNIERYLIVKDVVDTKISPYLIAGKLNYNVPEDNKLSLYFEYNDYISAIICQHNQVARFTKISRSYKRFLIEDVMSIYPELSRSECSKAFNKAKKGE